MNEFELPPELGNLEQQLAGLKPARHQIDSDAIMFEAGRQSVLRELSRNSIRPTGARLVVSALFGSVLGTAATILVLFSTGALLNNTPKSGQDRIASFNQGEPPPSATGTGPDHSSDNEAAGIETVVIDRDERDGQEAFARRLLIGQDRESPGVTPLLSTTGLVYRAASPGRQPVKTAVSSTNMNDQSDGSSYWQLMRQMRDDSL